MRRRGQRRCRWQRRNLYSRCKLNYAAGRALYLEAKEVSEHRRWNQLSPVDHLTSEKCVRANPGRCKICLHGDVLFHGKSWNVTAPGDNNPHHIEPHTGKVQYTMHAVLHLSGLAWTDFSEVKWSKGNI